MMSPGMAHRPNYWLFAFMLCKAWKVVVELEAKRHWWTTMTRKGNPCRQSFPLEFEAKELSWPDRTAANASMVEASS